MANSVNVDGLSREAIKYNQVLATLPAFVLNEIAKKLRMNIIDVQYEDRRINKRRRAGILRPYSKGVTTGNSQELMKFFETVLKPELIYAEVVDDITEYRAKKVLSNQGEWLDNKSKKHPLEAEILRDIILSYSEDIAFNLFHAERDESTPTAATAFTGFNPLLDAYIVSGEISAAEKNLVATGAIVGPATDTDSKAYQQLVDFIAKAHPLLRRGEALLYTSEAPLDKAREALKNKLKYIEYPSYQQLLEKVRMDAKCPNLQFMTDPIIGTGDRLLLAAPGLFDIGVISDSENQFVQVRNPFPNPNKVQFWVQGAYGTRISDIHPKLFQMNDQSNTSLNLAGDYK